MAFFSEIHISFIKIYHVIFEMLFPIIFTLRLLGKQ